MGGGGEGNGEKTQSKMECLNAIMLYFKNNSIDSYQQIT